MICSTEMFSNNCKINLSLRVIKKIKNNYHEIQSLVTFVKIFDYILINQAALKKDKITLTIS